MPATPFTHTLKSLADWAGPVNAGSGCLACLAHVLRGRIHFFEREVEECANCLDPAPEFLCQRVTHYYADKPYGLIGDSGCQWNSSHKDVTRVQTWEYDGGSVLVSDVWSGTCTSLEVLDCTFSHNGCRVRLTDEITSTMNADGTWSGTRHQTRLDICTPANNYDTTVEYNAGCAGFTDIITVTDTYCPIEQTEEEATEEITDAENDTAIWGADAEAQFPAAWPWAGIWWAGRLWGGGAMSPDHHPITNPASPLLPHTPGGRDVLRAKITLPDSAYPGQTYALSWAEVTRALGYEVACSGSERGRTVTTRDRTVTLTDQMLAPDDRLGSMAYDNSSWNTLGYTLVSVPTPTAPGSPPTAGFPAAAFLRRSRVRFAMRGPGAFTFRVRKVDVLNSDPSDYTTTFASLTTAGTLADDGTNSTSYFDNTPSSHLHSVYLFLDWVRDGDGNDVVGGLALAKVRDGWSGFRQLDHATLQGNSQFYRRMAFTQVSTIVATYIPDPEEDPPENAECLESLPYLDFTQTQVWEQVVDPLTGAVPDWSLASATGSGGGASWTGEVSAYDPPDYVFPTAAEGWTVGPTTATDPTVLDPDPADALNGALWATFARVENTPNPFFGGKILAVTPRTSTTTPFTYASGAVEQSAQIFIYADEPGTSVQIVNIHAAGV